MVLDAYRAVAAYGVAAAHFWAQQGSSLGEFWAAFFVELFFPLSGFVLAPQLMRVAADRRNLPVFYLRRWFRTLPPYWIALALAALLATGVSIGDLLLYTFFLQDTGVLAPTTAFYPIAWSLAVEEWFYLLFPVWICLAQRLNLRPVKAALLFCLCIQLARLGVASAGAGETLRTLTWWRLDAIAMGFLLWQMRDFRPSPGITVFLGIAFSCSIAGLAYLAGMEDLGEWEKWAFIQAAMVCSGTLLWASVWGEPRSCPGWLSWIFLWGGRVSYPIYLFHLFFLPLTKGMPGGVWIYLAGLTVFCAAFHLLVEEPILRRRPSYRPGLT